MKFNKEIKIGILALVSISILYFGFNFLKGSDFLTSNHTYYAYYEEISGLTVSNQVLVNGYSVGRVSSISIEQGENTRVKVSLDVSKEVIVGKDAVALLMDTDLLGGKAIELQTGDIKNPAKNYDTIQGRMDKSLPEVFADKAMPIVEGLDSTITNINEFFKSYAFASKEIQEMFVQAKELMAASQKIVYENRQNLKAISDNLKSSTDEFKKSSEDVRIILENMRSVSDSLTQIEINKTLKSLNRSLVSMDSITTQISSGEGSLGKLVYNDSLYDNLNAVSSDLDKLLIDFREKPKRYVHFSIFGKKDK
ncbi:MCE family protein [Hyphobacterium sp. CCMP332]|nr:MCE family protein [Hyphobacterium sp. CCMP332]